MCKRGDIYMADIPKMENSHIQNGLRPVVVVSNDDANNSSPVISVIPLTSKVNKTYLPTHVTVIGYGLNMPSITLVENIQSLDKHRLKRKIGNIDGSDMMNKINDALRVQFGI